MSSTVKLWQLLSRSQRRKTIYLMVFMLTAVLLETLTIGLIIPALAVMTQAEIASKYPIMTSWLSHLIALSELQLVMIGLGVLATAYAIKTLFLAYVAWQQAGFIFALRAELSQRLFAGYLRQSYAFHLQHNSAQLIRNVISQVADITNVIQKGLMLITESLVIVCLALMLIAIEPIGALLVVGVLGMATWGFNQVTRRRLLRWGALLQHHDGLRIQHLQQGLGGVKDVKLLGREDDFLQQYWKHNLGSAEIGKRQDALSALPRLWLEFLAVIGLTLLTYGMIWQGKPVENLVPTLGLFAAAAFRLMPSGSRVIGAVQSVHYSLPVIESLTEAFKEFERMPSEEDPGKQQFRRELNIENLRFRYDGAAKESIRGVSLTIPCRSSVGFIGSSGAGKSTLVDLILGLLEPTSGVVKVDGCDIQKNLRAWQDQIGYVPQSIFLTDDTLRRNIAFGLPNDRINEESVVNAIRGAQLEDFVRDLPDGLDTLVGERGVRLSGGQRQRIGIARALYHDPAILILDEATSSLDSATEKGVMEAVRALQGKKTVLIVAHRLSTVEYCSRLYRLEQGEIVDEGAANLVLKRVASF